MPPHQPETAPLSVHWAFVVHLRTNSNVLYGPIAGRSSMWCPAKAFISIRWRSCWHSSTRCWRTSGLRRVADHEPNSRVARMKRSRNRERKRNGAWIALRSIQATNIRTLTLLTNQEEMTMKRQISVGILFA